MNTDNKNTKVEQCTIPSVTQRFSPSFATDEFPWEANSNDDFICKIGDYTFRVEQMDIGHWWWRVYYKNDAIPERTNEFSSSKYRAIGYCVGLYMGHSLLNVG